MAENKWRNGFGLGLFVGLCCAVVVFLSFELMNSDGNNLALGDQESRLRYWAARLLRLEDSLAQWVMSISTLAALFVLVRTLRSANQTNIAAVKTAEAAFRSNELLGQAERPWLAIQAMPVSGIRFADDGMSLDVQVVVKNLGKLPALCVIDDARIISDPESQTKKLAMMLERAQDIINLGWRDAVSRADVRSGETIFPEQGIKRAYFLKLTRKQISDYLADFQKSFPDVPEVHIVPKLIACVYYKSPNSDDIFSSEFIVQVERRAKENPEVKIGLLESDGNIDLRDVVFTSTHSPGRAT